MAAPIVSQLQANLAGFIPKELVDRLLEKYSEIKQNYYIGKHEQLELNAGKMCEVVYRVLEFEVKGKYTPLGKHISDLVQSFRNLENEIGASESVRFHIPRIVIAVWNIRNKRGVGHVGGDVNPNLMDATYVVAAADWIMAELIRIHYRCGFDDAQRLVDSLVQRKMLAVIDVGNIKRVLNPNLSYTKRTLLILASVYPEKVPARTLFEWTEHSNEAVFKRDVLRQLHKKKLIEYDGAACQALPPGLVVVEENYSSWVDYRPSL